MYQLCKPISPVLKKQDVSGIAAKDGRPYLQEKDIH